MGTRLDGALLRFTSLRGSLDPDACLYEANPHHADLREFIPRGALLRNANV